MRFVGDKVLILIVCVIIFIAGCARDDYVDYSKGSEQDYVTASFQLVWESSNNSFRAKSLENEYIYGLLNPNGDIDPNNLCKVTVSVYDESGDLLRDAEFKYKDHEGIIRQVKAGPNRTFVVEGKICITEDVYTVLYRGEKVKDLVANIHNDVGKIVMIQDTECPQNPKISINHDDPFTTLRSVTLSLYGTDNCGITAYLISEDPSDPNISNTNWEKINQDDEKKSMDKKEYSTSSVNFTLSENYGEKTVYLWFIDGAGKITEKVSDNIVLKKGIIVSPISEFVTTEAGGMASFSIVLDTQPEADVTVRILSSDETEGKVDPNSVDPNNCLIFTPDNWNIAQDVRIIGVDDHVADGDIEYHINLETTKSADPKYNGLLPDPNFISLTNWDSGGSYFEPDANTIALWHLNIDGNDGSGNGNDLEIKEDRVSWVNGKYGRAAEMGIDPWSGDCSNSDGGALTAPGSNCYYPGNGNWTVEAWVQFPSINKDYAIVYHYSKDLEGHEPYYIGVSNGIAQFQIQDSNNNLDVVSEDISNHINQWIHIAGVYRYGKNADKFQKNGLELYINDTFAGAVDTIHIPETLPDYDVFLGGSYCGISTGLKIDEVRISNAARYGDTDSDGMPDYWESRYNLNLNDPNDAAEDPDEDHLYNFEEYTYRTDPTNSDTDGDGFTDGAESIAGCYPDDPNDPVRQIYYVDSDATGENDGTSWVDAYNSLQDALFATDFGDVIWVSEGIYKPDQSIHITQGNRKASFQLKKGVSLYGGFSGSETSRDQRDWLLHRTILSGDLNSDDGPNFINNEENTYHVVCGSGTNESAILDGFIITAGNANGSPYYDRGGGMYIEVGNPRIINCTFKGNFANLGSGIHCYRGSSPIITNCIFTSNLAGLGGGIACSDYAKPIFADCTITDNHANSYGGGMACQGYPSWPTFTNCIFWGNSPDEIACGGSNDPNISYSDIQGGYIGGTGNIDADPLFINPNAQDYHLQHGSPCIDAGDPNSAALNFPEKDIDNESRPFGDRYDMGADEFYDTDNDGMPDYWEIKYNLVQGDPNNKDEDPDLDGLSNLEEYKNGTNPVNLDTDGDGCGDKVEISHGTDPLDQESYPTILYVNTSATGDNNGANWNDAFKDLQDALTVANLNENFQEIWVTQGTYQPDQGNGIEPGDRTASFHLKNGVAIYGGFAGGEENIDQRDWELHQTILSGDLNGDDDPNFVNYEENSFHIVIGSGSDVTAVLDGFIITGGNANGSDAFYNGGGMYNSSGNPTVTNCTFTGNRAKNGGGIYNNAISNPTIKNCLFSQNSSLHVGGGMYNNQSSSPIVINCIFDDNLAEYGAGIYNHASASPELVNCKITNNRASANGGAILCYRGASPILKNCIIAGNTANNGGAFSCADYAAPGFINCTIVNNHANQNGGALYNVGYPSEPVFINCIIWNNFPNEIYLLVGDPKFTYSNIKGGYDGEGNIDSDPLFGDNYHLQAESPCRNAGDPNSAPPSFPNDDMDKEARPQGERYDMGADEFHDTDSDGMPDYWEMKYSLNPGDPNDAARDADDDVLTNLEEYTHRINPVNADTDGDDINDGEEIRVIPQNIVTFPRDGSVTIIWDEVSDANWYTIYMAEFSNVSNTNYSQKQTVDKPYYKWEGLTNGTTYYFLLTSESSYGESGDSYVVISTPNAKNNYYVFPDFGINAVSKQVTIIGEGFQETPTIALYGGGPYIIGSCFTPGNTRGVSISGTYAYVAHEYSGLQVIDISDPANPNIVVSCDTPGDTQDVSISGVYAYVADGESGLQVIDISNPTKPGIVGFCNTPGYAYDVSISGAYAYVADGESGLQVIDISDPNNPSIVGFCGMPSTAWGYRDVFISGTYAYVADTGSGLQVIDISDPENPGKVGFCDTPGSAWSVSINGAYAYVADGNSGLQVIDISTPANPNIVGFCDTPVHAYDVSISGTHVYVVDDGGLQVIDIGDPTNPSIVSSCNTPGHAQYVSVSGAYAYVGDTNLGFRIIDISTPVNPGIVSFCDTPRKAQHFSVSGDYAYVADDEYSGLQVIDISKPANPCIVGSCYTPWAYNVSISGSCAYVADRNLGLQIIDISDPANPGIVGSCDTPNWACCVSISGAYAYVADWDSGLQVIDISDLNNPYIVGSCDTPGLAHSVSISGAYAYVADESSGLQVIEINDPNNLKIVGSCNTPGSARDVSISGAYAYVADWGAGLRVVDISVPTNPGIIGSCDTPGYANHVSINGVYAYVADDGSGLQVIDISTPANPSIIGSCNTQDSARDVYINGRYVYVADGGSGLQIIERFKPLTDITYLDSYIIKAIIPEDYRSGTYNLHITNPDGEHTMLHNAFTVYNLP